VTADMEVEVRLFAMFREAVGEKRLVREYDATASVRDVLADVEATYPALDGRLLDPTGELPATVSVMRNGRHVAHFDGPETELEDGDAVSVTPPVTGGAT